MDWLVESILKKCVIDSEKYLFCLNNDKQEEGIDVAPSPASKRNILSMSGSKQGNRKRLNFDESNTPNAGESYLKDIFTEKTIQNESESIESLLINEYANAQPSINKANETVASTSKGGNDFKVPQALGNSSEQNDEYTESEFDSELSSNTIEPVTFLANLKVHIRGFDVESAESLIEDCKLAGAEVILDTDSTETVDFLILPVDAMTMDHIKVKARNITNHNWLVGF